MPTPESSATSPASSTIRVEVVHALPQGAWRRRLRLPAGSTAGDAVAQSGFLAAHPEQSPGRISLGIFGRRCHADQVLADQDRVEILRPLEIDPMERRRRRARPRRGRGPGATSGPSTSQ
ncbi:MAG: RnfH family protein [Castellaniella sp.]